MAFTNRSILSVISRHSYYNFIQANPSLTPWRNHINDALHNALSPIFSTKSAALTNVVNTGISTAAAGGNAAPLQSAFLQLPWSAIFTLPRNHDTIKAESLLTSAMYMSLTCTKPPSAQDIRLRAGTDSIHRSCT
jgi:hypothetical protein